MAFDARPRSPGAVFDRSLKHETLQDSERHATALALKRCEHLLAMATARAAEEQRRASRACASSRTLVCAMHEIEDALQNERAAHARELQSEECYRREQLGRYETLTAELQSRVSEVEDTLSEERIRHERLLRQEQLDRQEDRRRHAQEVRDSHARLDGALQLQERSFDKLLRDEQRRAAVTLSALQGAYDELKAQSGAAVAIASNGRGQAARREYAQKRKAAVRLQAAVRASLARRALASGRAASVALQAAGRQRLARHGFHASRAAAVRLQSAARGHLTRRRVAETHRAAETVQKTSRQHRARTRFQAKRAAAVRVQTAGRGLRARRGVESQHRAATQVQAAMRGRSDRQMLTAYYKEVADMEEQRRREQMLRTLMMYA